MRRLILIIILMPLLTLPRQSTLACSGGANREIEYSIEYMLVWSDFFVKAQVIAADEANQNFILDVISSQKGMPPKQLVLANTSPLGIRSYKKFGQQGCFFGGRVHDVRVGDVGYFPLQRNLDGSYSTFLSLGYGLWYSKFNDQTVAYTKINPQGEESSTNWNTIAVPTEAQFNRLVYEKGGTLPIPNTTYISEFMPLPPTAPILLTTDTGKQYMLPMDGENIVPLADDWLAKQLGIAPENCYQADCVLLSPDTSLGLVRKNNHTLVFQYIGAGCTYYDACTPLDGQTGLFSTTNDALAVWNKTTLDIYQFINKHQNDSTFPVPHKIISLPLKVTSNITENELQGRAVWSNDGNMLVFADAAGLWLIDLYRNITPRRIVSGNASQSILPISLTGNGRFLSYSLDGSRANWLLRDLQSNAEYHNLVLSPDGRYGLALNTVNSGGINTSLLRIFPQNFPKNGTWEVQWLTPSSNHYIKTCASEIGTCHIEFCSTSMTSISSMPSPYICWTQDFGDVPMNDADYDHDLGLVYVLNDGKTVYTESRFGYKWQPFIDGNIIDVEWMLPRFYYEYQHP